MSQENLEVVKRVVTALNARDIDGCLACCTPTIEVRTPWGTRGGMDEGPEGIRRFWTDFQYAGPVRVEYHGGPAAVEAVYRNMLEGKVDPSVGHMLSLHD